MGRRKTVTKRPTYREAVQWIALNDNAGNGDSLMEIAAYISTALVADLFGADTTLVAIDIQRIRSGGGGPNAIKGISGILAL